MFSSFSSRFANRASQLKTLLINNTNILTQKRNFTNRNFFFRDVFRNKNAHTKWSDKGVHSFLLITGYMMLSTSMGIMIIPIYRLFCTSSVTSGYGIKTVDNIINVKRHHGNKVKVRFRNMTDNNLPWKFTPLQEEVIVDVGETALAFYRAKNESDEPVTGISSYAITPYFMSRFFIKIQCFCFEEQRLEPGEEVDMPVFFYIDPEILKTDALYNRRDCELNYIFYKSKRSDYYESLRKDSSLPLPSII